MKTSTLSDNQKSTAYAHKRAENFVESMRLEGYSVDASLLALNATERKKKKAELIKQFTK